MTRDCGSKRKDKDNLEIRVWVAMTRIREVREVRGVREVREIREVRD